MADTVEDAAWSFSASQVESWLTCRRKWGFNKIARIRLPQKESTAFGDRMHKQLEGYLQGGDIDFTDPTGNVAAKGVHLIPQPNTPGVRIEEKFRFQSPRTGFVWTGRIDFLMSDAHAAMPDVPTDVEPGEPGVGDHKSCKTLYYAKSADDLWWDPQGILYSYALMYLAKRDVANLFWVYYPKQGGEPKRVHLRVLRDHAVRGFKALESVAGEMYAALEGAKGRDPTEAVHALPASPRACKKFGGCEYEPHCRKTPQEEIEAAMGNTGIDSLFADLEKRAIELDGAEGASSPLPGWATAAVDPMTGRGADPINPPPSDVEAAPAPSLEDAPTVVDTPKAKRGRPRKVKEGTRDLQKEVQELESPVAEESPTQVSEGPRYGEGRPSAGGFVLYVDCFPVGVRATLVDRYVEKAKRAIQEQSKGWDGAPPDGYADPRFIPYGKGAACLAIGVLEEVEKDAPAGVLLSTASPEGRDVLSTLMAKATLVVKGA